MNAIESPSFPVQSSSSETLFFYKEKAQNVVFFDGVCLLCNGIVQALIRLDTRQNLMFAPLQGTTYQKLYKHGNAPQHSLDTIVFYTDEGQFFTESDAVLLIITALGGIFRIAQVFRVFPQAFRNALYRLIAQRRYRWFGKRETCMIPARDVLSRFLP
jgi:predicted DCC family thiol-disulfide oxidoreductase YuxK